MKREIENTLQSTKVIESRSEQNEKLVAPLDRALAEKIKKITKAAREVIEHIESRNDK